MSTIVRDSVLWGATLLGFAILVVPVPAEAGEGNAYGHGEVPPGHQEGFSCGNHDGKHEQDECPVYEGAFSSAVDPSPGCTSPVGFCTIGELTGDIEGTYAFRMDSMVPVSEDPAETTFAFTGSDTITTADGVIYGEDSGTLTFSGDFAFMTIVRAVSGEGCFEDISGTLVATGNLDLVTGVTSGTWTAELCGIEECFEDEDHHDEDDEGGPSHHGECH